MPSVIKLVDSGPGASRRRLLNAVAQAYRVACEGVSEPERLRRLFEEHYDRRALFLDPLFEGRGYDGVLKYCERLSRVVEALRVEQWETVAETDRIAIRWTLSIKISYWPFPLRITGMTLLTFNTKGKCVEHAEYWDLFNALLNIVPVVPRLDRLAPRGIREHLPFLR